MLSATVTVLIHRTKKKSLLLDQLRTTKSTKLNKDFAIEQRSRFFPDFAVYFQFKHVICSQN